MIALLYSMVLAVTPTVDSKLVQVAPSRPDGQIHRSPGQKRAVVLIHGFWFHVHKESVARAGLRPWQVPRSPLVLHLAREADVFSFGYAQDVSLEKVVEDSSLREDIARLR